MLKYFTYDEYIESIFDIDLEKLYSGEEIDFNRP